MRSSAPSTETYAGSPLLVGLRGLPVQRVVVTEGQQVTVTVDVGLSPVALCGGVVGCTVSVVAYTLTATGALTCPGDTTVSLTGIYYPPEVMYTRENTSFMLCVRGDVNIPFL